jgi:hypothetical protein
MAWLSTTLSNGTTVHVQQNLRVISLIDVEYEWRKGRFLKIRKGDKCLVRQEPCGAEYAAKHLPDHTFLHLGKATGAWNFRQMKEEAREGVDFEVIDGEVPYPPLETEEEIARKRERAMRGEWL